MSRLVARCGQTLAVSLVLLCAGASAALAGQQSIESESPAPAPAPSPVPGPVAGIGSPLRWMLDGAGALLLAAAVTLVAVLWHRSHAAARRVAIH